MCALCARYHCRFQQAHQRAESTSRDHNGRFGCIARACQLWPAPPALRTDLTLLVLPSSLRRDEAVDEAARRQFETSKPYVDFCITSSRRVSRFLGNGMCGGTRLEVRLYHLCRQIEMKFFEIDLPLSLFESLSESYDASNSTWEGKSRSERILAAVSYSPLSFYCSL